MKAILWTKFGGAEVLKLAEMAKPKPKPDELLIKVKAFTVNRTDCAMLKSSLWIMRLQTGLFKPNQPILGTDFAGEIEAVGSKVDRFKPGDRVFGFDDTGIMSHAEYMIIKQKNALAKIPENISFDTAAASLEGPHYGENFLNKVDLKEGQSVFIHGATGGIGSALLQLCKINGAETSASCRPEHSEQIMALGAKEILDYTATDFFKTRKQYDFVFDAVGKGTFPLFKTMLKPKGVYISSELGPRGQNLFFALASPVMKGKKVKFPLPLNRQKSVDMMAGLLEEKKYQPLIDRTYKFEQTPEAFEYVLQAQKLGNVVISLSE